MSYVNFYLAGLILTALSAIWVGLFVFSKNAQLTLNRSWCLLGISVSIWSSGTAFMIIAPSHDQGLLWARISHVGASLIPVSYLHFIYALLKISVGRQKQFIMYGVGLIFALLSSTPLIVGNVEPKTWFSYYFEPGSLYGLFVLHFFGWVLYATWLKLRALRTLTGVSLNQLRYVVLAATLGFVSGSTTFPLVFDLTFPPLGSFVFLYVAIITWAIVRHHLMDINVVVTRTAVFLVVYTLVLGLPLLGALVWEQQFEQHLGRKWWVWLWIVGAFLTTAAHYTNLYLQQRAEARLLRDQRRYQASLLRASQGMTQIRELQRLLNLIVYMIRKTVGLTHAAVVLEDPKEPGVFTLRAARGQTQSPLTERLTGNDPLIALLKHSRQPIVREELASEVGGQELKDEKSFRKAQAVGEMQQALQASVVVPSFREETLIGFLVLGEKRKGQVFTSEDLTVFSTLANQAAVAIENARFYEEEKQRQAALFHAATLASLGTMASSMGHQVNNRFNVVSVVSSSQKYKLKQMLASDANDPATLRKALEECQVQFQSLEDEAIKGGQIVASIRKLTRPSTDGHQPLALKAAIQAGVDVVQHKVHFEAFDFQVDVPDDLPLIQGDLSQLGECFLNFIDNASDSINTKEELLAEGRLQSANGTPAFRGSLRISARLKDAGTIEVTIRDTGTGVDRETLGKLFVPFFTTKATAEKGTGLGLYVIKKIVEAHDGTIRAESTYGEGMTFVMELPVAKAVAA